MRYLTLGKTNIQTSEMGFGCMGMSEFYGEADDAESLKTLERAFDLGVTLYDTSNVYGRGHNEKLVGQFARGKRDKLVICSKFGVVRDPSGPSGSTYDRGIDNSPLYMRRCCEESLTRLGIEAIDLYYVHRVDPNVPIEETAAALAELIREGKIKSYGLSEVTAEQLRRAHAVHPVTALQSEYSLWNREPELDVLPACKELGITFIAYSPLGRGFLTGAIKQAGELKSDDFRLSLPRFQGENFDRNQVLVGQIKQFATAKNCTPGQIALTWLYYRGQDIVPIPGTKRIKYLEENVGAKGVKLTQSDLDQLEEILPLGAPAGSRYDAKFGGNPQTPKS
ncbi:putative Aldo/keto reductase (plasmid) [Aromatoleum aromaticum EbN1]|uniref:Aldo/keto reductase n=1 Tax=Aromatoleum aromaticum (strain DSM 19018 / LMG 30748 / EbN1) TaxID=76114 RepID=Q5NW56_AROAE|nr:aldo/keto reductase [Aromatoleum aromaticum]CAI10708.1 putative Aldo/keto reductase [Aromatoleum aromaticum EbN1]